MNETEILEGEHGSGHEHRIGHVGHEHVAPFNTLAVVSFITAFVAWPVGFVTALAARREIRRSVHGERGSGLVLASLIISAVMAAVWFVLGLALLVSAINPNWGARACFGGPNQITCIGGGGYVNPGGPIMRSGATYSIAPGSKGGGMMTWNGSGASTSSAPTKSPSLVAPNLPGWPSMNQPSVTPAG